MFYNEELSVARNTCKICLLLCTKPQTSTSTGYHSTQISNTNLNFCKRQQQGSQQFHQNEVFTSSDIKGSVNLKTTSAQESLLSLSRTVLFGTCFQEPHSMSVEISHFGNETAHRKRDDWYIPHTTQQGQIPLGQYRSHGTGVQRIFKPSFYYKN